MALRSEVMKNDNSKLGRSVLNIGRYKNVAPVAEVAEVAEVKKETKKKTAKKTAKKEMNLFDKYILVEQTTLGGMAQGMGDDDEYSYSVSKKTPSLTYGNVNNPIGNLRGDGDGNGTSPSPWDVWDYQDDATWPTNVDDFVDWWQWWLDSQWELYRPDRTQEGLHGVNSISGLSGRSAWDYVSSADYQINMLMVFLFGQYWDDPFINP